MLAQSTGTALATAHDPKGPESSGPSASRGNKAGGLAGLFSELLSQASKSLGANSASGKAASAKTGAAQGLAPAKAEPKAEAKGAQALAATKKSAPSSAGPAMARQAASALGASPQGAGAAASRAAGAEARAAQALAREMPCESTATQRPPAAKTAPKATKAAEGEAEDGSVRGADEKRKAKAKGAVSGDEAQALASFAQAAAGKPVSRNASLGVAAPSEGGVESDPSIENRKAGKGGSEAKLTVLDLRRSAQSRKEAAAGGHAEAKGVEAPADAMRDIDSKGQSQDGHKTAFHEMTLDARPDSAKDAGQGYSSPASAPGRDFQSLLAERMREAWNGEIVQSAHIVLKDGDSGTIRLRLKPESLGNVKIELNLSDNNISGKIVVESDEAKSAFERNMGQLADAFKQGGFESASLQVSVGGGSGGDPRGGAGGGEGTGPFYSERLRSATLSSAEPAMAQSAYSRRGASIDILA